MPGPGPTLETTLHEWHDNLSTVKIAVGRERHWGADGLEAIALVPGIQLSDVIRAFQGNALIVEERDIDSACLTKDFVSEKHAALAEGDCR